MADLLAKFQQLTHIQNELFRNDNEQGIFQLLDACERLHRGWQAADHESIGVRRILLTYEDDMAQVRVENKELKGQLVESRSQIAGLVTAREDVEKQNAILQTQVDMARELLRGDFDCLPEYARKKLQFLNERPSAAVLPRNQSCSVVSEAGNGIDYDKTEESLNEGVEEAQRKGSHYGGRSKRSISLTRLVPHIQVDEPTPRKRSRDDMHISNGGILNPGSSYSPQSGDSRSPLNRSFSEPNNHAAAFMHSVPKAMRSVADLATLSPATGRRHTFLPKTGIKVEYCDHCEKRFSFAGTIWRCDVCKLQCHAECRDLALLPCVARGTPTSKHQRGKLADFVSKDPPMVPNVIVHCINEMERRGLASIGLYRVPGSESQVVELLDKFLHGRGVPNLRAILDINVLAGCIKKFLQQLIDPLIPSSSWNDFVAAALMIQKGEDAVDALHRAIIEMPQPNRDTLAFLMIHLQKIVEYSDVNKMTATNIAKIFGPTIVGHGSSARDLIAAGEQLPRMEAVMHALLSLTSDYWGKYLSNAEFASLMGNMAAAAAVVPEFSGNPVTGSNMFGSLNFRNGIATTPKTGTYKTRSKFFNPPWK